MILPKPTRRVIQSIKEEHEPFFGTHYKDGEFSVPWGEVEKKGLSTILSWKLKTNPYKEAKKRKPDVHAVKQPLDIWRAFKGQDLRVMWLGHASFMVEMDGMRVLIDPLFGDVNPFVRRHLKLPLEPNMLPRIDAVLLTHGHFDHLNVMSLDHVARMWSECVFIVPKGQQRYLPASCASRWVTVDWWQDISLGDITLTYLPSQHWHQRGLTDYNKALWGGWWLQGSHALYHPGDSGYFEGFKVIREVMGKPDVMTLPMGAYEPRWFMAQQHMDPQQALMTWRELGRPHAIPMHYGTFDLSDEPIDLGPKEFIKHCDAQGESMQSYWIPLKQGGSVAFRGGSREG